MFLSRNMEVFLLKGRERTEMKEGPARNVVLVLGGARSGKSRWAQTGAERVSKHPVYLATAEAGDAEMRRRISRHRKDRGRKWRTVEEPLDIARVISSPPSRCDGIVVDCLTIWMSNVMIKEGESAAPKRVRELIAAVRKCPVPLFLVSNEVGMGIVPHSELGREFRDASGRMNQAVAQEADEVQMIVAGLPLVLKRKEL